MNPKAFSKLFATYGPAVYRRCLRLLGEHPLAEDATQDVFTGLLTRRGGPPELEAPLHYLYRAATHACVDRMRQRSRQAIPVAEPQSEGVVPHAGGRVVARDFLDRVLATLTPRAAEAALCIHLDGMTQHETARHLEVSRKTVQRDLARFARAAQRLRREEDTR